ncbi:MAG: hypothetical protein ACI9MC_003920 [Kiritimatiellia bacterium]|jgi:hypothetical protein
MSIDRLSRPAPGLLALTTAIQHHTRTIGDVQGAANSGISERDQVQLSSKAQAILAGPPPALEQAMASEKLAAAAVQAAGAVARADDERFQALVFLVAHHGPPIS